jgi:microcystin-dependent protein|nr:tail fiber protein [uncultured Albidiferax sp.]
MKSIPFSVLGLALASVFHAPVARAELYLGEILCGGWNFAPRGTAVAAGQLLSIAQNTALFSLLGTQYGGDGRTTFALPDLRGRKLVNAGQAPGLSTYDQGAAGGVEALSLQANHMPGHSHLVVPRGSSADASQMLPVGNVPANKLRTLVFADATAGAAMASASTDSMGQGQPVPTLQPYLTVTCVIATQGVFPPRQ